MGKSREYEITNMVRFQLLLSCMNQNDKKIIQEANINCNSVIVNQCHNDKINVRREKLFSIFWINSKDRGLSKSRNLAIKWSNAEICLIADDDELIRQDCEKNIILAFNKYPNYDVIIFNIKNLNKPYKNSEFDIGYLKALKVSSVQIAFRREKIINNHIWFDEKMGSGTGNGSSEENKFLYDCLKAGLRIKHVPIEIATLKKNNSTWFKGFTKEYFINRGWSTRRYMGLFLSIFYSLYFAFNKYERYKTKYTILKAIKYMFIGINDKRQ